MSSDHIEAIQRALASVEDPEIRKPITELGMVKSVEVSDDGIAEVTIYLTIAACPLRETITTNVTAAVVAVEGITGVNVEVAF